MSPVPVSPTLAANELVAERRRRGLPVLPLGFGESGLPVHPAMAEALAAAVKCNAYGPVAGSMELRRAAADYWSRRAITTDPSQMVCGPGSKPLLYGLVLAFGGDVVLPKPSWVSYAAQARLMGGRPLLVPTFSNQGGVPDPELMDEAVAEARAAGRDIRAVVVTLPDNPTGTIARPDTIRALCRVARAHDLAIVSDEIYRDVVFDPSDEVLSPAMVAPERTFVTTALSKNLALGGWRIGVARVPDSPLGHQIRGRLLGIASEIWSGPAGPIQRAAAYAFDEPPELVAHIAKSNLLHGRVARAVADRFVSAGAVVASPRAGFYSYPDFSPWREYLAEEWSVTTDRELTHLLLDRYGVGVLPGGAFGDDPSALRFRVSTSLLYGDTETERATALTAENPLTLPWISAALTRLAEVLADLLAPAVDAELEAVVNHADSSPSGGRP